jgi:Domain of unknown function (DUF397)
VTPQRDLQSARWRKSSYSGGSNGSCLEVADGYATVPVRDSKNPTGPTLVFATRTWAAFTMAVAQSALPTP